MGMDVRFGMIYGIEVWNNILEDKPNRESVEYSIYDIYTGKLTTKKEIRWVVKYKLLIDVDGFGKAGDLVLQDDFKEWIIDHRNTINNEDDEGLFIYDYNGVKFFGIKAFNGHEPYEYPQDMCIEFLDETKSAEKVWKEWFPRIPGKLLLYMRVSV